MLGSQGFGFGVLTLRGYGPIRAGQPWKSGFRMGLRTIFSKIPTIFAIEGIFSLEIKAKVA
jgi:hypothetical protein